MPDLTSLNQMPEPDFVETLSGVYESSPWVAQSVAAMRPFSAGSQLAQAMREAVGSADPEKQQKLILAHPDLGGKLGRQRDLTVDSAREQSSLGLDRLDETEFALFTQLNTDYRARFGFPFIICVGLVNKSEVLAAFRERLGNTQDGERLEALRQIDLIAGLRLAALIS
jgi:2-oxo-4-hydroxy-4-carboxy-5-ureidoimidazoline decarboxylase